MRASANSPRACASFQTADTGTLADYADFSALEDAFRQQIDYFIDKMLPLLEEVERAHQELLPTPFLSAVVDDCMERGVDVTRGGARYNLSGIQMIQVANLADSLAALKELVYEKGKIAPRGAFGRLQQAEGGGPQLVQAPQKPRLHDAPAHATGRIHALTLRKRCSNQRARVYLITDADIGENGLCRPPCFHVQHPRTVGDGAEYA